MKPPNTEGPYQIKRHIGYHVNKQGCTLPHYTFQLVVGAQVVSRVRQASPFIPDNLRRLRDQLNGEVTMDHRREVCIKMMKLAALYAVQQFLVSDEAKRVFPDARVALTLKGFCVFFNDGTRLYFDTMEM